MKENHLEQKKTKEKEQETDEQLLIRYREGEEQVLPALFARYKDFVRIKAHSMYIIGGDSDDLIQEGMIGLLQAVRDYDFGRDASFATFARLCISRQMYTALQAANRKKHAPLNHYVSLYGDQDGEGDTELLSVLGISDQADPEQMVIDRENVAAIYRAIEEELSPLEKQVLELKLTGMGYAEIAKVLGRDAKSTDNALNRIKNKLKGRLLPSP